MLSIGSMHGTFFGPLPVWRSASGFRGLSQDAWPPHCIRKFAWRSAPGCVRYFADWNMVYPSYRWVINPFFAVSVISSCQPERQPNHETWPRAGESSPCCVACFLDSAWFYWVPDIGWIKKLWTKVVTLSWSRLSQISVGISMDISHPYRLPPILDHPSVPPTGASPFYCPDNKGCYMQGASGCPGVMASWLHGSTDVNSQQVMACVRDTNTDQPFLSILKHHSHSFPTFSNLDPLSGPFSHGVLSQGNHEHPEHEPTKMQDINQDTGMRWAKPPGDPFTPTRRSCQLPTTTQSLFHLFHLQVIFKDPNM